MELSLSTLVDSVSCEEVKTQLLVQRVQIILVVSDVRELSGL